MKFERGRSSVRHGFVYLDKVNININNNNNKNRSALRMNKLLVPNSNEEVPKVCFVIELKGKSIIHFSQIKSSFSSGIILAQKAWKK